MENKVTTFPPLHPIAQLQMIFHKLIKRWRENVPENVRRVSITTSARKRRSCSMQTSVEITWIIQKNPRGKGRSVEDLRGLNERRGIQIHRACIHANRITGQTLPLTPENALREIASWRRKRKRSRVLIDFFFLSLSGNKRRPSCSSLTTLIPNQRRV